MPDFLYSLPLGAYLGLGAVFFAVFVGSRLLLLGGHKQRKQALGLSVVLVVLVFGSFSILGAQHKLDEAVSTHASDLPHASERTLQVLFFLVQAIALFVGNLMGYRKWGFTLLWGAMLFTSLAATSRAAYLHNFRESWVWVESISCLAAIVCAVYLAVNIHTYSHRRAD